MMQRLACLSLVIVLLAACGRVQNPRISGSEAEAGTVRIEATIPGTLVVGTPATITFELSEEGQPIEGAEVRVEGNMTHAGMQPVLTEAGERTPGEYTTDIEWSMSGEWFLAVQATLPDGRVVERTFEGLEVSLP